MTDLRRTLERIGDRAPVPEPALDRLVARRARKHRQHRIVAGVVGVLVFAAVALGFVLAEGLAPAPQPRHPVGVAKNGWIAFSAELDPGDPDIFVVREGEAPVRVAGSPGVDEPQTCPAFSPDGRYLAYEVGKPGGTGPHRSRVDILQVTPDGTSWPLVQSIPTWERTGCAVWSPGSNELAYYRQTMGDARLELVRVGASSDAIVPTESDRIPPPGILGAKTSTSVSYRGPDTISVAWSPDGTTIAVGLVDAVYLLDVRSMTGRIEKAPYPSSRDLAAVAWSPDGSSLAVATPGYGSPALRQLDVATGNWRGRGVFAMSGGGVGTDSLAWSPDGRVIAFFDDTSGSVAPRGLHTVDVASGLGAIVRFDVRDWAKSRPQAFSDPVWSPDGRRLAFVARDARTGSWGIVSTPAVVSSGPFHAQLLTPPGWNVPVGTIAWQSEPTAGES